MEITHVLLGKFFLVVDYVQFLHVHFGGYNFGKLLWIYKVCQNFPCHHFALYNTYLSCLLMCTYSYSQLLHGSETVCLLLCVWKPACINLVTKTESRLLGFQRIRTCVGLIVSTLKSKTSVKRRFLLIIIVKSFAMQMSLDNL